MSDQSLAGRVDLAMLMVVVNGYEKNVPLLAEIAALEAERDRVYESGIAEQRGFNRAVRNIACWALGFADGGGKTKAPIRDTATVFVEYLEGTYPDAFSDQLVSDNGACVSREGDSLTTTGESPTAGEPTGTTNGILERQIVEESRKDAEPLGNPAAPSGEDLLTPDTQKSPFIERLLKRGAHPGIPRSEEAHSSYREPGANEHQQGMTDSNSSAPTGEALEPRSSEHTNSPVAPSGEVIRPVIGPRDWPLESPAHQVPALSAHRIACLVDAVNGCYDSCSPEVQEAYDKLIGESQ